MVPKTGYYKTVLPNMVGDSSPEMFTKSSLLSARISSSPLSHLIPKLDFVITGILPQALVLVPGKS